MIFLPGGLLKESHSRHSKGFNPIVRPRNFDRDESAESKSCCKISENKTALYQYPEKYSITRGIFQGQIRYIIYLLFRRRQKSPEVNALVGDPDFSADALTVEFNGLVRQV